MNKSKKKILIIGSGFGGVYTAKYLYKLLRKKDNIEVSMVSPNNYFLFTPLLHEVATGGVAVDNIVEPIREVLGHCFENLYLGEVKNINLEEKYVQTETDKINFDYLVLAPGAETNFYGIKGAAEYSLTLKSLEDAIKIRNTIIEKIERAQSEKDPNKRRNTLSFVVVGGGPTGVELVAEMIELIKVSMAKYYKPELLKEARITLIEGSNQLLKQFSPYTQTQSLIALKKKGVQVLLNSKVAEVGEFGLIINDNMRINAGTIIWVAGIKPVDIKFDQEVEKYKDGRILVNRFLQLKNHRNVFAIGDMAAFENSPGKFLPALAQVAHEQAKVVAENIYLESKDLGIDPHPFYYKSKGGLVSIGQWMAVAEISNFKFSGHIAWWLWRTVYLTKMISFRKKIKIAIDWTLNIFRPRDISKI